jgi:hypothetical protein
MNRFSLVTIFLLSYMAGNCQSLKHYKKGYYFTKSGEKIDGYIISVPALFTIAFKPNESSKKSYVKIRDIKAVVLTEEKYDSLSVQNDNVGDSYFAKLLFKTPNTTFYHKYILSSQTGAPTMSTGVQMNPGARGSAPSFHNTYSWRLSSYPGTASIIMFTEGDQTFPLNRKNYFEVLKKALSDSPEHITKLNNKEVKYAKLDEFLESYSVLKAQ